MNTKLVTMVAVVVSMFTFACGGADSEPTATRNSESSDQQDERNEQTENGKGESEEGMDETRMTSAQRCWRRTQNERCWELNY